MSKTTEELKPAEDLTWRRHYEYRCAFCKKKRTTRSRAITRVRVCTVCAKARLALAEDKKLLKLF